jgi:hypothetical protein
MSVKTPESASMEIAPPTAYEDSRKSINHREMRYVTENP